MFYTETANGLKVSVSALAQRHKQIPVNWDEDQNLSHSMLTRLQPRGCSVFIDHGKFECIYIYIALIHIIIQFN